jgi:hypothetical protein
MFLVNARFNYRNADTKKYNSSNGSSVELTFENYYVVVTRWQHTSTCGNILDH